MGHIRQETGFCGIGTLRLLLRLPDLVILSGNDRRTHDLPDDEPDQNRHQDKEHDLDDQKLAESGCLGQIIHIILQHFIGIPIDHLDMQLVVAVGEIGVLQGGKLAAAHGDALIRSAFEIDVNGRIEHGEIHHGSGDLDTSLGCRQMIHAVRIRQNAFLIAVDTTNIGQNRLVLLVVMVDIDLDDAVSAGDKEITILVQSAVGIGRDRVGQTVFNRIEAVLLDIVLEKVIRIDRIDAIGGQDPGIAVVVKVKIVIVIVREGHDRLDPAVLHAFNGVGGHEPVYLTLCIPDDTHDDLARQSVLSAKALHIILTDHIDAVAVCACQIRTVLRLRHGQKDGVIHAVLAADSPHDFAVFDDNQTAVCAGIDTAIIGNGNIPHLIAWHPVLDRKRLIPLIRRIAD